MPVSNVVEQIGLNVDEAKLSSNLDAAVSVPSSNTNSSNAPLPLCGKRVMVFSESLGPINGVTRATQLLLNYLSGNREVEVVAVAPEYDRPTAVPLPEKLPLIRLKGFPLYFNPDLLVVRPFRVAKILRRTFRPDVVYLASPASLGWQAWFQLRWRRIPIVANFQTDLSAYSLRMLPFPLNKIGAGLLDLIQAKVFKDDMVKTVLYPSQCSREYLMRLGVPASKLKYMGRGVDSQQFNPNKRSPELRQKLAPNGEVLLLCVSRLSLEKGFDFLAEAYAEMLQQAAVNNSRLKFKLVITGGNSNATIEQHIKELFEKKQLGDSVVFTGPLTGEALAQMYATADVFVFPSQTETFGQVIQEAMASGLPVVAVRAGGPADLVQSEMTGYLAEPNDVKTFAEAALNLVQDELTRRRMGQAARQIAESRSWDNIHYELSQILAEAAS